MIGVCIKYMHENYGGILQAYATTCYLETQNIHYELIRYKRRKNITEAIKDAPRLLNVVWLNSRLEGIQKKLSLRFHKQFSENNNIRMKAFSEFKKWAFHSFSEEYVGYEALCSGAKKYSTIITGSDQLWSPAGLPTNFYNLMFAPESILKISIASSFGVKDIPWYQRKRTIQYLKRLQCISMRENRGREIVQELIDQSVPVILDPVFFLSSSEWLKRIPNELVVKEPYIFAYFLGTNPQHRKAVEKFAHQRDLKIVTLRHMDQYVKKDEYFGDIAPYDVDPRKFLNLLRNAQYVCTDSFHGTAFSIINQKQFIVFNRYHNNSSFSKNSRIDTLCANLGLEKRRFTKDRTVEEIVCESIDYSQVSIALNRQKEITNDFLQDAVKKIRQRELEWQSN